MNAQWRDQAACAGLDYDLFFGKGWSGPAIETCQACPVTRQCLTDALTRSGRDQVGIRGGLYACQRVAIIKARARTRGPYLTSDQARECRAALGIAW